MALRLFERNLANVVAGLAHCALNRHSASVTELRI
jgi:hypothetical protein